MQYMLKAKLEHQKSLPKNKPQTQGDNWEVNWQRKGIWICFTFPACRSACLHVALHVQSWYHDATMKIDEIHWPIIGRCSLVEANAVSGLKIHLPSPAKIKKTTHLHTCDTYNTWHKVWTYTSATSFEKLTFLLAFIPSLRATQLIDGVMKKRLTPCPSTKDSVRFFWAIKKRSKNSWS